MQPRSLGIQREHGVLGLIQRFDARLEQAAAVFAVRAEHVFEERRRQFVVLGVGVVGVLGDRSGRCAFDETAHLLAAPFRFQRFAAGQTCGDQAAHAGTGDRVGDHAPFAHFYRQAIQVRCPLRRGIQSFGGQGMKALVRRMYSS